MFSFIADKLNVKNLGEMLAPTYTPEQELHAAIEEGLEDKFLRLLDEQNVSPHATNDGGNAPIHTAAYYGRVRMIEALVGRGIDVNTAGPRGNAPLHFAASQSHFDTVKYLITSGANPALRNRMGKTAYDISRGDSIRQYLLPLQFRHEDPNEAMARLPPGITPSTDPMAPRPVIAPPPTAGMAYNPSNLEPVPPAQFNPLYAAPTHSAIPRGPAARISRGEYRPIQADGFGTSVGNEQLTAKYGNTRDVKVTAPPPMLGGGGDSGSSLSAPTSSSGMAAAPPAAGANGGNPYASARASAPSRATGFGAPPAGGAPQFKIFNPKLVATNTNTNGTNYNASAQAPGAYAPPAQATYGQPAPGAYGQPPAAQGGFQGGFQGGYQGGYQGTDEVTQLSASASVLQ